MAARMRVLGMVSFYSHQVILSVRVRRFFIFLLGVPLLTGCGKVPDASSLNIEQMIINIAKTMPSVLAMFSAAAYIIGFALVMKGIYKLKEYGEMRTTMSSQTNIWGAIITLAMGSLLIFFVSSYQIGLSTLFGNEWQNTLSYSNSSGGNDQLIQSVVLITQVVGVIAFIRGILLLNSAGGHGAQPGSIGKGLTFIVGGLLAINVYGTWQVLVNTLIG